MRSKGFYISRRRLKQVLQSVPHYLHELRTAGNLKDLYSWTYNKMPNLFRLIEFPLAVGIELTNKCNMNCIHCNRKVMRRPLGYMSAGTFTKIIDELSAHQESTLVIGGLGEPSVHPHLGEMLDQLKKRQIKNTMFSTNGSLLRFFSPEQILTWNIQTIVVSIDGLDSESYSQIRIGGNYDGLRECLHNLYCARKSLKKVFPIIEIRHVIFPNETAAQLRKFQRHWLKYADTVKYNFVVPSFSTIEFPTEELRRCREIRRTLYVRWDGRVPLCGYQYLYSEAESLGNIDNYSIEELFKHPRLQDLRELHSHKDFSNFDFCRYCVFTHG